MVRYAADFSARWTVCWATTYTFEPTFFQSFLLRRLGEPPLNVTVLTDFTKLAETWAEMGSEEYWGIRGANRDYLVRGVPLATGAFHAKTTLLANGTDGVLLVGSGNLGLSGVEQGHEVFSRFVSRDEADLPAFSAWRDWMGRVITLVDDPAVRSRWGDLLGRMNWLAGDSQGSAFVTNWSAPLVDQLIDAESQPSDELLLTAPFFDTDLRALRRLIERARPRSITVYLGRDTSVAGNLLIELLRGVSAQEHLLRYEPDDYVHAKLIAVIRGDRARILAGSANLSGPALLQAVTAGGHVNVEAGSITELDASRARELFVPPGMDIVPIGGEVVAALRLAAVRRTSQLPIRLSSAAIGPDRRVAIIATPPVGEAAIDLTDGTTTIRVSGAHTVVPFETAATAVLVWLVDSEGVAVSNRVPPDDPAALLRALNQRTAVADRPVDLDELDLAHPMGLLLAELHLKAFFDIDDTPAARRLANLSPVDPEGADEFWDRLLYEELGRDPRATRYSRRGEQTGPFLEELTWLLNQMLHRAPVPGELRLLSGETVYREGVEREGQPWTANQRLQVRAFNVLHRWALAVADPRVRWFSELAQVRHYEGLLGAVVRIWPERWLPEHRVIKLAETLFGAFVRTERKPGYLASLDEAERSEALTLLQQGPAPAVAAAIAFAGLRNAVPATFFEWQPFLAQGLEWGVFEPDDETTDLIETFVGLRPSIDQIRGRLHQVTTFIDDEHWCERIARNLGFAAIRLRLVKNPTYRLEVEVDGAGDVLRDTRLVTLVREAFAYRNERGIRLKVGNDLLTIAMGEPLYGRVRGRLIESDWRVSQSTFDELEAMGSGFGAMMSAAWEAVS